jgi:aspartate aminotransferase
MWFSTPCNPSGSVYNRENLLHLLRFENTHVYVVADEIYEHINFQDFCSIGSIPGMFDKTITVNGVAKALL